MILVDEVFSNCINSPVRRIKGRVELYEGSTLLDTFCSTDKLKSFTIERVGEETKFFGYGVCQKLTVKLVDKDREVVIAPTNTLEALMGTQCYYAYTNPVFYVDNTSRDENTNELTITAYDALHKATAIKSNELTIAPPYTLEMYAAVCARALGLPLNLADLPDGFNINYPTGANVEGTETVREMLDAIAEATQTIYFINHDWELTFKRLDVNGAPVLTIDKSKYFTLKNKEACTLTAVCSATELGDNLIAGDTTGRTQYIRDNPFWTLRDDVASLVQAAADRVSGLTITQFSCSWRGNYLLEIGDKIAMVTKDNETITSYIVNDSITYDGAMKEQSEWTYQESQTETHSQPATLGETIKYTYAKVDKVNKRVEIVASEVSDAKTDMAQILVETNSIRNSVAETNKRIDEQDGTISEITKKVETQITPEEMTIAIKNEMLNGVDKITTSTGFTFNEEGLTVSKSGSEMTTTITEDGMSVYKDGNEVLTADNTGVKAENLHATTYLIIGKNSRFEDYNGNRTGCFWIGG